MSVSVARAAAVAYLAGVVNADGSWGYLPGQPGKPEPTLLAAAACATPALAWLGANELGWGRLMLPAALSAVPGAQTLRNDAVAWIRSHRATPSGPLDPKQVRLNGLLAGWPWADGLATFIEPTSYAMISLRSAGFGADPGVAEGELILLDRQCDDGGWNYGNPEVFETRLTSDLTTTGWAAMAVTDPTSAARALAYLATAAQSPSASSLSLAVLAHVAKKAAFGNLADLLMARQRPDGSFGGRADWTALAACALGGADTGSHPFV